MLAKLLAADILSCRQFCIIQNKKCIIQNKCIIHFSKKCIFQKYIFLYNTKTKYYTKYSPKQNVFSILRYRELDSFIGFGIGYSRIDLMCIRHFAESILRIFGIFVDGVYRRSRPTVPQSDDEVIRPRSGSIRHSDSGATNPVL